MTVDLDRLCRSPEGRYLERKSLWDGPPGAKRPRDRRGVRDQIARVVAAFANADGGQLLLGVEDDGEITGHGYPPRVVDEMLAVPERRLHPPGVRGRRLAAGAYEVLLFDVEVSPVAVMVEGDGYPVRDADNVLHLPADRINAWKQAGLFESWEARPSPLTLDDLDPELLRRAAERSGLGTIEQYLVRRRLADPRGSALVLRRAAELLFAAEPHLIDHPNAGVRIFRVMGTERLTGIHHNVQELERQEGALPRVIDAVVGVIKPLLRTPRRLRGTRFEDAPEYPEFAWQEAIINALAHREWSDPSRSVAVTLFDDRMEVESPGAVLAVVSLDDLVQGHRSAASRNPRLTRCLVDLGYMREQGEGIPRMFGAMTLQFLPAPEIDADERRFVVTLRNTPTITPAVAEWLASLNRQSLNEPQIQALVLAQAHGRVSNSELRDATGLDTLQASTALRTLRDRGLLDPRGGGAQAYWVLVDAPTSINSVERGEPEADRGELDQDRGELDADRGELRGDRGEHGADGGDLDEVERELVTGLGARPRREKLQEAIIELLRHRPMRPAELARVLGRSNVRKLVDRHLAPLLAAGQIRRTIPDRPTDPNQAYYAANGHEGPPDQEADAPTGGERT